MKNRRIAAILAGVSIMLFISGCQDGGIGEPPANMKTVTQNSTGDNATFEYEIPEDWMSGMSDALSVGAFPEAMNGNREMKGVDALPYSVLIDQRYYHDHSMTKEEQKIMFEELFAGDPEAYEEHLQTEFSVSLFARYEVIDPPEYTGFTYKKYQGENGPITEVCYSETHEGKTIRVIRCYREDIPYMVTGVFDESLELSSGDLVPWVASSLKVTEHYLKDDE